MYPLQTSPSLPTNLTILRQGRSDGNLKVKKLSPHRESPEALKTEPQIEVKHKARSNLSSIPRTKSNSSLEELEIESGMQKLKDSIQQFSKDVDSAIINVMKDALTVKQKLVKCIVDEIVKYATSNFIDLY